MRRLEERKRGNYKKPCACGCGELIKNLDDYGRPHKFKHGHNKSQLGRIGLSGENSPTWKGGITINWSGYRLKKVDKKYIREHRLIFEEHNKCCLLPWSHVHHINGNKKDNDPRNLLGMTHSQHSTFTHKGKSKHRSNRG